MTDSPLFVKTYDLLCYLIPVTQGFPRSQRFVLAKRIQDAGLDFYESLLEARKVGLEARVGVLRCADVELEKLRLHLRLSMELEFLKFNQYEHASKFVVEIGGMLHAWRTGTDRKLSKATSV